MLRPAACVALALAVVLAGCGGASGAGEAATEPTATPAAAAATTGDTGATATAAPAAASQATTTTATTTTAGSRYPPGVTADGLANATALADAHAAALGESFTVHVNETATDANGTLVRQRVRTTRRDGDRLLQRTRYGGIDVRLTYDSTRIWSNGSTTVVAMTANGSTDYELDPGARTAVPTAAERRNTLYGYLGAGEFALAGTVERGGETLYRLESRDEVHLLAEPDASNASFAALVTDAGLVSEYRLTYDATLADRDVRVVRTVRFTDAGNTTVERPDWVDDAFEQIQNRTEE